MMRPGPRPTLTAVRVARSAASVSVKEVAEMCGVGPEALREGLLAGGRGRCAKAATRAFTAVADQAGDASCEAESAGRFTSRRALGHRACPPPTLRAATAAQHSCNEVVGPACWADSGRQQPHPARIRAAAAESSPSAQACASRQDAAERVNADMPWVLKRLARDADASVRAAAASNRSCRAETIERLARDDECDVRAAAAGNRSCPAETLRALAWDKDLRGQFREQHRARQRRPCSQQRPHVVRALADRSGNLLLYSLLRNLRYMVSDLLKPYAVPVI